MAGGLSAYGRDMARQAHAGLSAAARHERYRENAERQMKSVKRQERVSNVLGGAMAGGYIGAKAGAVGGPAGMAIGALVGFAATELF